MSDLNTRPASRAVSVTPNDDADLTTVSRGLHVNVAGNIAVIFENDASSVVLTVVAGVALPYRVRRVLSTGTTATGIFALL